MDVMRTGRLWKDSGTCRPDPSEKLSCRSGFRSRGVTSQLFHSGAGIGEWGNSGELEHFGPWQRGAGSVG